MDRSNALDTLWLQSSVVSFSRMAEACVKFKICFTVAAALWSRGTVIMADHRKGICLRQYSLLGEIVSVFIRSLWTIICLKINKGNSGAKINFALFPVQGCWLHTPTAPLLIFDSKEPSLISTLCCCHTYLSRPDHSSRLRVFQLQGFLHHSILFHLVQYINKSITFGMRHIMTVSWVGFKWHWFRCLSDSVKEECGATHINFPRYS